MFEVSLDIHHICSNADGTGGHKYHTVTNIPETGDSLDNQWQSWQDGAISLLVDNWTCSLYVLVCVDFISLFCFLLEPFMCPYPCGFITEFNDDSSALRSFCRVHIFCSKTPKRYWKVEGQRNVWMFKETRAWLRYASLMYIMWYQIYHLGLIYSLTTNSQSRYFFNCNSPVKPGTASIGNYSIAIINDQFPVPLIMHIYFFTFSNWILPNSQQGRNTRLK